MKARLLVDQYAAVQRHIHYVYVYYGCRTANNPPKIAILEWPDGVVYVVRVGGRIVYRDRGAVHLESASHSGGKSRGHDSSQARAHFYQGRFENLASQHYPAQSPDNVL
jgi:hypothetical protein